MGEIKIGLQRILNGLKELEGRARKLENQNIADVIAAARGKVTQLSEHPHLELLDEKEEQPAPLPRGPSPEVPPVTKEEAISYMHARGSVDPEGTARINWPHLFGEPGRPTELPRHSYP
jgi:hypothetical protein